MKKIILILVVVLIIGALVVANLKSGNGAVEVQTEKVFRGNITQTVTGNGKIYPVTEVNISARVAGEIVEINAEEGDSVKAGQVLVRLDSKQYQASRDRAKSQIDGAKADVTLAEKELERIKKLYQKNLSSASELETAQAKYQRALSVLQQAQASYAEAVDALQKTILKAPIDGVIIKKNKEVGEIALGSQFQADVILVLADLSSMEARVEVNENDIVNVSLGDSASIEIDAFPDTTFPGIVTEISNSAQTKSAGTIEEVTNYEVKTRLLEKLPTFRPGMSATSDIAVATHKNVLQIPIQSLTARDRKTLEHKKSKVESTPTEREAEKEIAAKKKGKKDKMVEVVFVVQDGIAHMRPVKVGISDENYYEVLEGVSEGDEVVTGPFKILSRTLKDGERVKIKNKKSGERP